MHWLEVSPNLALNLGSCSESSFWKAGLGQWVCHLSGPRHALWVGENSSPNLQHLERKEIDH